MTHAISIPKLGLTMEDAIVVEWTHADGERVAKGETVITIETDKIMFDVEAEHDGFLQRVAAVGAKLLVGDLAGYLHPNAEAARAGSHAGIPAKPVAASAPAPSAGPAASAARTPSAAPASSSAPASAPGPAAAPAPTAHPATLSAGVGATGQRLMVSPVARQLAQTHQLDLRSVAGSGPGGVILKRDVEAAQRPTAHRQPPIAPSAAPPTLPATTTRTPLSSMRKVIAQRMKNSLATKAQMTGFGRVDMAEAAKLREAMVGAQEQLGARITYTDIVLKAAATVLAEMPEMNAFIDGDDIVTWSEVNIGLAVAIDGGLIVPVIRNVDRLSLVELSQARQALIAKARAGKLAREDVDSGTFTVSNFGSYGGDFETPILNAPQSALLGIGQITDEPVVRDKQIVIRPMMAISLTFDHCLIDGALAGQFRARFKALLEQPALILARLR